MSIIHEILSAKYGENIFSEVAQPQLTHKQQISTCTKSLYLEKKMQEKMTTFKLVNDIYVSWPHKVPHEVIFKQLN